MLTCAYQQLYLADMHSIALVNYKGGVTKTSTAANLGAALASLGNRVLLVDCDPQSHLSEHVGIEAAELEHGLEDVFERGVAFQNIICETTLPSLLIAPCRRRLAEARSTLSNRKNRDAVLAKAIRGIDEHFDYMLVDSPPDEGILSVNAMYACRYILIPTTLEYLAVRGIGPLIDSIVELTEAYDHREWNILGVLINKYDKRSAVENRRCIAELQEAFEEDNLLFDTRIRIDETNIKSALREGKPVPQYNPSSKAAIDFQSLAIEVETRLGVELRNSANA